MPSSHPSPFWSRWWRRSSTPPTLRFVSHFLSFPEYFIFLNFCPLFSLLLRRYAWHTTSVKIGNMLSLYACQTLKSSLSCVSSLAGNSRAREDLPHVLQRGAGGCNQGYLDRKRLGDLGLSSGQERKGSKPGLNVMAQPQLSINTFSFLLHSDFWDCRRGFLFVQC